MLVVGLLAVAACSGGKVGGVDGPVIFSGSNPDNSGEDALISGIVSLEGECLYLMGDDNDPNSPRDLVVWPAGTKWQADPAGVVLPNGDVALLGEVVEGGGGYHGPDYVLDLAGEEAAALAERCAGPGQGVAIFNRESDVELIG